MNKSESVGELAKALAKAQAAIHPATMVRAPPTTWPAETRNAPTGLTGSRMTTGTENRASAG